MFEPTDSPKPISAIPYGSLNAINDFEATALPENGAVRPWTTTYKGIPGIYKDTFPLVQRELLKHPIIRPEYYPRWNLVVLSIRGLECTCFGLPELLRKQLLQQGDGSSGTETISIKRATPIILRDNVIIPDNGLYMGDNSLPSVTLDVANEDTESEIQARLDTYFAVKDAIKFALVLTCYDIKAQPKMPGIITTTDTNGVQKITLTPAPKELLINGQVLLSVYKMSSTSVQVLQERTEIWPSFPPGDLTLNGLFDDRVRIALSGLHHGICEYLGSAQVSPETGAAVRRVIGLASRPPHRHARLEEIPNFRNKPWCPGENNGEVRKWVAALPDDGYADMEGEGLVDSGGEGEGDAGGDDEREDEREKEGEDDESEWHE